MKNYIIYTKLSLLSQMQNPTIVETNVGLAGTPIMSKKCNSIYTKRFTFNQLINITPMSILFIITKLFCESMFFVHLIIFL